MTGLLIALARLAFIAAILGSFGVIAGVALGSLHWSIDLAGQFLLPSAVASVVVAAVAAIARWLWIAAPAGVAAVLSIVLAVPWVAAPAESPQHASRFRVLLFNVWDHNRRLEDVRAMIEKVNADLVVIVEAGSRVRQALAGLNAHYPYSFTCAGSGSCDILMLSRARLFSRAVRETSDPERSPFVLVEAELAGCRMTLLATHLTRPFPNRPFWAQRAQAEEIGDAAAEISGAKLVVGDFNAAPWGHVIRTIADRGGLSVLTGPGGTWPSPLPSHMRIPIDHFMAGKGLSFVSREVLPMMGSDHLPVLAEVAVTDPSWCR